MNTLILAQAQAQAAPQQSIFGMLIPFALMFVVIYFFIIRPQSKKQKEHAAMLNALEINDKVITNSGIIGIVVNIKTDKNIIVLRVDDTSGARIEFQRSAISGKIVNE
ncbi:MAG TPA: preprotein translocase subunit YajC [Candidatus Cloacimonadota bacterium]|nr:preprotein translocase subunit YajC [Candidatus Cloacimonadota bacterium]HOQ79429.1 preprotein translocase subunit YajC [Candidatus Cloacimonadota bacterium]